MPIHYDDTGIAYLRKDSKLPATLEAHIEGDIYIHLKSSKVHHESLIAQACQKIVYHAINQVGEIVAASVIHETSYVGNKTTFETEKKALALFKGCPYILQVFHANSYASKKPGVQKYGFITEYCHGHADTTFLTTLPLKERWTFFLNILEGVNVVHEKGYHHFDLKAGNILYKKIGNHYEPRIIDFGVMHHEDEILDGARGAFLPPEWRKHENFPMKVSESVDVWGPRYVCPE